MPKDFSEFIELLQKLDNKRRITNALKTGFRFRHGRGRGLSYGFSKRDYEGPSAYPA